MVLLPTTAPEAAITTDPARAATVIPATWVTARLTSSAVTGPQGPTAVTPRTTAGSAAVSTGTLTVGSVVGSVVRSVTVASVPAMVSVAVSAVALSVDGGATVA